MAFDFNTFRTRALIGSAIVGIVAALPAQASAQEADEAQVGQGGLDEIIVTATRRAENLQEVPIAVSAVTAEALDRTGIDATRDLPQLIPSVQFTRSGPSGLFFVRGVGTTNAAAGEEGANAVYVDNVYMPDLGSTINYFNNIERVEVLKGPQGTLFGRNATGGLVHVITREPGDEFQFDGELGVANYETISARAYLAGPIAEGLSADLAVTNYHQNEGWGRNLTTGTKNMFQDYWGARSKIVAKPSDGLKFILAGDYFKNRDNPVGWRIADGTVGTGGCRGPGAPAATGACANPLIADDHDTTANDIALTKQEIYGGSLTAEADLGFATLTSITAYRNSKTDSDFDVDGGPGVFNLPTGPAGLLRIVFASETRAIQQELRLASNDSEPLAWQIGAFYLDTHSTNQSTFLGAAFAGLGVRSQAIDSDLQSKSYAVFGEATYAITPTTKITGGIRYTKDKRHFVASQFSTTFAGAVVPSGTTLSPSGAVLPVPGRQDSKLQYDAITWRAAIRQEITPDISIYASANRGFKSGSYSLQNPLNEAYLPQYIMAYEAGIKSEFFDRRLRLNVSGFHYDIDDYQVRSAAAANPGSSLVLNAATVKVDGVELEFEAAPTDALRLFGGVTWLNSRYGNFGGPGSAFLAPIVYPNPATCPVALRGTRDPGVIGAGPRTGGYQTCFGNVSGNKVSNSPEWATSFGATYIMPVGETGEVRFTGLWSYNSGYYFEPDNRVEQSDYHLLNASVEYRPTEQLGLEFFVRNLTDTDYAVQKISTGTGTTQVNGAPRTYGVNLKFDF